MFQFIGLLAHSLGGGADEGWGQHGGEQRLRRCGQFQVHAAFVAGVLVFDDQAFGFQRLE
ncbi:hypothetical protein D3C78_1873630 [compost metagenome]